ncbi:MAG: VOC family protein [Thermoplasmatota archaeon]
MAKRTRRTAPARSKKTTKARPTARKARAAASKPTRAARRASAAPPTPQPVTPYLAVNGAAEALQWYRDVLGAKEVSRQASPDGKIWHAEFKVDGGSIYLSDIFPGSDMGDPTRAAQGVNIWIYSKRIDAIWAKAVDAGAKVVVPIADMFWGQRWGKFVDPFGHGWSITYRSKLPKAELDRLRQEATKGFGADESGSANGNAGGKAAGNAGGNGEGDAPEIA